MTLEELAARVPNAKKNRDGYRGRCPCHDGAHPDSLSVRAGEKGRILIKCFAGCTVQEVCKALGIHVRDLFAEGNHSPTPQRVKPARLNLADLANDKMLPIEHLKACGVTETPTKIIIVYRNRDGSPALRNRIRTALSARDGSFWSKGPGDLIPYGLDQLEYAQDRGYLILVEGESDCWTLWLHRFPALGIPGADMLKILASDHLDGIETVYFWREPDKGGDTFARKIRARLKEIRFKGEVREVRIDGFKDPNDLHKKLGKGFDHIFGTALDYSVTVDLDKEDVPPKLLDSPLLDPAHPIPSGQLFRDAFYMHNGHPTLYHQAGQFFSWRSNCYRPVEDEKIRADIYLYLERAQCYGKKID